MRLDLLPPSDLKRDLPLPIRALHQDLSTLSAFIRPSLLVLLPLLITEPDPPIV